jgi:hypothetical protein|tara:strand:+ start:8728 stop:8883 length:156 start_codon:yes stop_codon:yes gene_type:complete
MINGIHHTALSVKDMDRSLAFYKPEPTPMADDRPVIDRGITHICLDVTDVD